MMKKIAVALAMAFAMSLTACSDKEQEKQEQQSEQMPMHEEGNESMHDKKSHEGMHEEYMQQAGVMYQCPMKCEKDKMYDKVGECPVCHMPLEKVEVAPKAE